MAAPDGVELVDLGANVEEESEPVPARAASFDVLDLMLLQARQARQEECRRLGVRIGRWIISFVLGASSLALLVMKQRSRKTDAQSGVTYDSAQGIFCCVLGVVFAVKAVFFPLAIATAVDPSHVKQLDAIPVPQLPDRTFHHDLNVLPFSLPRKGKFAWLVFKAVANMVSTYIVYWSLPPRDPSQWLNEARYYVASIELLLGLSLPFSFFNSARVRNVQGTANALVSMGSMSSLRGLSRASPSMALRHAWGLVSHVGLSLTSAIFAVSVVTIVGGSASLMALLVKMNQINFVTEASVWSWSLIQWVHLAGFVNNLTGILPDHEKMKIRGILEFLEPKNLRIFDMKVGQEWAAGLLEEFGFLSAVMIWSTLTASDVGKLLNKHHHTCDDHAA